MKVVLVGAGAFSIGIARALEKNSNNIVIYTKFEEEYKRVLEERENKKVLPGIKISKEIEITNDLESAMAGCDIVVMAVPIKAVRNVISDIRPYLRDNQVICLVCKGLDPEKGGFMTDVVYEETRHEKIAVLSGPSFAVDIANYKPIALTCASKSEEARNKIRQSFENENLKIELSDDIIGVQLGGALKNVGAIGSGILEGMKAEPSTKAAYVTSVLKEMVEYTKNLGGKEKTMYTYAGLGDLVLCCTSTKSRNYRLGVLIGKGKTPEEANKEFGLTVEGVNTLEGVRKIIRKHNMNLPIIETMYDIIVNGEDKEKLIEAMLK